jgi:ribosomal 30S subunit maturation factor RimM
MPVKIKGVKQLDNRLKRILPDARSAFAREMKRTIVDIIVEKIVSGISPVKGQNRYKRYSEKYADIKGRKQPVDLVATGKMLENLRARQTAKNSIILEFPSAKERQKASAHNEGTKDLPQRKILPTKRGETFKSDILNKIIKIVEKAINNAIR